MDQSSTGFRYRLVFLGEVLPGFEARRTKKAFAKSYPVTPEQLNRIFSGGPVILRPNVDRPSGLSGLNRLAAIGMACEIQLISGATTAHTPLTGVAEAPARRRERETIAQVPLKRSRVYAPEQIKSWFPAQPLRIRPRLGFRLRSGAVALAMLTLPAIYLLTTGLAAAALCWHAVAALAPLTDRLGTWPGTVVYAALLLMGSVATLLLVKPLVAGRVQNHTTVTLDPTRQRAVVRFVMELARCMGVPAPAKISVDHGLRIKARRSGGMAVPELSLIIGMPLVLGLNVQSLAGLLAREFGRWSDSPAMRAGRLVQGMNGWAYQRIHEADTWDRHALALKQSKIGLAAVLGNLLCLGYNAVRGIFLSPIARVNARISRATMRQLTLYEDQFEIQLCGSQRFERTARRLRELAAGSALAHQRVSDSWSKGKLVDNLPALSVQLAQQVDPETGERIASEPDALRSDPWQVRPAEAERIAAARRFGASGQLQHAGRAKRLFYSLDELCRKTTFAWYRAEGLRFSDKHLAPVSEFAATADAPNEQRESLTRLFGDAFSSDRVLLLPNVYRMQAAEPARLAAAAERARSQWNSIATEATAVVRRREELLHNLRNLRIARALIHGEVSIDANAFNLASAAPEAVDQQLAATVSELQSMEHALAEFEKIQAVYLAATLAYGCAKNHCRPAELSLSLNALNMLRQHAGSIVELEAMSHELRTLAALAGHARTAAVEKAINDGTTRLERMLATFLAALRHIQNPLNIDCTLAHEIDEWAGDRDDIGEDPIVAATVATAVARCMRHLNVGITSQITDLAERVVAASPDRVANG